MEEAGHEFHELMAHGDKVSVLQVQIVHDRRRYGT